MKNNVYKTHNLNRHISRFILDYLDTKIILISGPRQVGKTTLAKSLSDKFSYYNYDIKSDALILKKNEWNRLEKLVIFDEIHKMRNWKLWLKGLYDADILKNHQIAVTGSARLDVAKKMGDSLAGRFFSYRLNPLDLKELCMNDYKDVEDNYKKLISRSGFPEPFFSNKANFYGLWKKSHSDLILKQDLISYENVRDIDSIELLIEMLANRVGSTVSMHSLAEDLDRDEKTIKKWITSLENLFILFKVSPYSKNLARGIKKASKYYFYDTARVEGGEEARLENLVALSLKKEVEFLQDTQGKNIELHFAKTKDQKELDFVILDNKKPKYVFEVKLSDSSISPSFYSVGKYFNNTKKYQLVRYLDKEKVNKDGIHVTDVIKFLSKLDLS